MINIFNGICSAFLLYNIFINKIGISILTNVINIVSLFQYNVWNSSTIIYLRNKVDKMIRNYDIEIIKYNEVLTSIPKTEIVFYSSELIHDFFIYSDFSDPTLSETKINKVNKLVFYDIPKIFVYTVCNIKFFTIMYNTWYPIKLCSDTENYYIVGNRINKLLLGYLLKKQHNISIRSQYKLEIVDHNIESKIFDETDEIIFIENDYRIFKKQ